MIERNPDREPYTAVKNRIIYQGGLTPEELGLYTNMLSRPVDWEFNEFVLAREFSVSVGQIRRLLESLAAKGYTRERKGRYGPVWDLYERSILDRTEAASETCRNASAAALDLIARTANAAALPVKCEAERKKESEQTEEQKANTPIAQALFDQAKLLRERNAYRKANGRWPD